MKQTYQKILADKRLIGVYIALELLVVYILASLAIDTAKIIYYILVFLLIVDAMSKTLKLFKKSETNVKKAGKSTKA